MVEQGTGRGFHVVAVGASAGGLEALETLFRDMPRDTGMAFVVLQHLSPDFESRMDELLARQTALPVKRVSEGIEVEPDAIYLIPPRKDMVIANGRLHLTERDPDRGVPLPIDHFFRSLAHDVGPRAVAIVLSGTGSDGSRGVRDVHAAGGLVIAQREDTARFDGMPRAARATGVVDLVLAPADIPDALRRHAASPRLAGDAATGVEASETVLQQVFRVLRGEYGIDFAHYKPTTVQRRIERRMSLGGCDDVGDYLARLRADPAERAALYRDLLIGVTQFFRDPAAFDEIERDVVPRLLEHGADEEGIRVWVAGCASGEEAYSLAILFHEALEARRRPMNIKIFATDVHRESLEAASQGRFPAEALEGMRPERVARYFRPVGDSFQVVNELRQLIVFARHNLLADAPFTRLSLVSCRNLLIYLQPAAQHKALSLFHFGLRLGGYLFLGPSETTNDLGDEFEPADKHWRLFRKRRESRPQPDLRLPSLTAGPEPARPRGSRNARGPATDPQILVAYDRLLDRFMPPSLLVDEHHELLHTFGGAERYTRLRGGRPSTNVLDLLGEDLRTSLSGALQHARQERRPVRYTGLRVDGPEGDEQIRLTVEPVEDPRSRGTCYLVVLESLGPLNPAPVIESEIDVGRMSREYIESLEVELRYTRENLQATIEELETSNEELQATNEELVSANEELQSTNEELHSVNEELYTINVEHQRKIQELTELNDDMDNLLQSTLIGVVFLDADLHIRRFTARAAALFGLLPQDLGRSFVSFANNVAHPGLIADLRRVIEDPHHEGVTVEREVCDRGGNHWLLRVLPYRARGRQTGAVLTLVDIESLKRAEDNVRRLSAIVESTGDAIVGMDLDGVVRAWNRGAAEMYGWPAGEAIGRGIAAVVPADRQAEMAEMLERVAAGETVVDVDTVRQRRDGSLLDVAIRMAPVLDAGGRVVGASAIERDVTRRKQVELQVRDAVRQRERFLAILSHELRNPLASMTASIQLLEMDGLGEPERNKAMGVLQRQGRHMARLLDDLLEISRIQTGKIQMRRERVELTALAREVIDGLEARLRPYAGAFVAQIEAGPLTINGDPHRLQQLLVNLLTNAIKYTPPGRGIRFVMRADGAHALFFVQDEGQGIPAEGLTRIFEPFVQMEHPPGHSQDGMGLGLALARSIVEAHGGEILARSDGADQGSEFRVRLPLAEDLARSPARLEDDVAGPPLVVVVEDQDDTRELVCALLMRRGYRTLGARDGHEGLRTIFERRPRVALVDVGMPGIDGCEVARRVHVELGAQRPFLVALTGYGQDHDRAAVRSAGFDRHVVKPFELEHLLSVLDEAFSSAAPAQAVN